MNQILKNSPAFIFFIAILLVLSTILPVQTSAATPTAKQKWKTTLDGETLFEPIVQKDGSLLVGTYKIVNNVYKSEIMILNDKGKKKKSWKLNDTRIKMIGTEANPKIMALSKTQTVRFFNISGEKIGSVKLSLKGEFHDWYVRLDFDDQGDLYVRQDDNIYKYSKNGKLIYKLNKSRVQFGYESGTLGTLYNLVEKDAKEVVLSKYSSKGEMEYSKSITLNNKKIVHINSTRISEIENKIYLIVIGLTQRGEISSKLYAVDEKGNVKWSNEIDEGLWEMDIHEDKNHTIITGDNFYYQFDSKGKLVKKTTYYEDTISSSHLTSDGGLIVKANNKMLKFNASGSIAWKVNIDNNYIFNSYYLSNNEYIVAEKQKYVYVYNNKGKRISRISVGAKVSDRTSVTRDAKKKITYVTNTNGKKSSFIAVSQ